MRTLLMGGGVAAAAAAAIVLTAAHADPAPLPRATTPIQHVVVIFDENESFDHYFGTYPNAANPAGEPAFTAAASTPSVDGLSGSLLTANPNGVNPQRIDRSNALTCDMNHAYGPEQQAFDGGLMDKFPQFTANGSCTGARGANLVMDYFDGNTVTALWNYAQHFSMSDNSFGSGFGPSTPGAIELVSGQTHGLTDPAAGENGTMIADPNPIDEDCGSGPAKLTGLNVGDLMNTAHVTWGWFQGGFRPTSTPGGIAHCDAAHNNIGGAPVVDYSAHHEPFQYYDSTANPHHLPPTSTAMIGQQDAANHQYDLSDFDAALAARQSAAGVLPEGRVVRGRPSRLLRSDRRAALPRAHDQRDRAVGVLAVDGDLHRLRRLRRLVRPQVRRHPERFGGRQRRVYERRSLRRRRAARRIRRTAAASVRACRCWSSRPTRRSMRSITHRPSRRRS